MGMMPKPGTVFEHKYLIEELIGEGGFAAVFRARDIKSQRLVAIKVLVQGEEHWQKGTRLRQRFEREADLLAQLTNEHTVRLLAFDESEAGAMYLVFEFVDGIDLHDMLDERGPLSAERVKSILQQVCSALEEAHRMGVLHRDIKPANIMVYRHMNIGDLVKLLDFGIAKPMGDKEEESNGLTTAGIVLGTPRYMSPEQISGSRLEAGSDIYSLGLVAFELLTGRSPIGSDTRSGIVREQLMPVQFAWPKEPDVPKALRRIIDKMLEKDKRERYQSCGDVLRDLENMPEAKSFSLPVALPFPKEWAAAGVVGAAVIAAIIFLALGSGDAPASDVRPTPGVELTQVETPPGKTGAVAKNAQPDAPTKKTPTARVEPTRDPLHHRPAVVVDDRPTIGSDPPLDDDIRPVKLKSFAAAKSLATSAYMMNDWDRLIAICKSWATDHSFCARMLADAYKAKGDVERSCFWYDAVSYQEHGLPCPEADE